MLLITTVYKCGSGIGNLVNILEPKCTNKQKNTNNIKTKISQLPTEKDTLAEKMFKQKHGG